MSHIIGKVIKGDGYGKKIGYPTINLDRRFFLKMKERPKFGVYTGSVRFLDKAGLPAKAFVKAGIVIGPLDTKSLPKIEAHLIGYTGNLYGKKVELKLSKFIRPFKKFKNETELINQIKKDISLITKI